MPAPSPALPTPVLRRVFPCLLLALAATSPTLARTDPAASPAVRLDQAKNDSSGLALARLLGERAQALVFAKETPVITRAKDAAGLASPRHLKPLAEPASPAELARALAQDDEQLARQLAEELPELAAAYRLSGLGVLKLRVLQQIEEVLTWKPLARTETAEEKAPQSNAAYWLTLRALQDTLDVFPKEDIPAELASKLDLALIEWSGPLFGDLREKRLPFLKDPAHLPGADPDAPPPVRRDAYASSDWLLFHETVISLATRIGPELCRDDYAAAVANIRISLKQSDSSGAWRGGLAKAMEDHLTLTRCARTLATRGEPWLARHDFFPKNLGWISSRLLPARSLVNTGDTAGLHPAGPRHETFRRFYSQAAILGGQPQAWFFLLKWFAPPSEDRFGIIALCDLKDAASLATTPPPYHSFSPLVPTLIWRNGWDDFSDALWTTAGYPGDPDTHLDRGHVSYFRRGRPVLIEAGTPPPGGDAGLAAYFSSQTAHNVLQIGTKPLVASSCSLRPGTIDENGGSALLLLTPSTGGLATSWSRKLEWSRERLVITDTVTLPPESLETIRFRFHLGDPAPVAFAKPEPFVQTADSPVGRLEFRTNGNITLEQSAQTNFTLFTDPAKPEPSTHTCIEVRTTRPVSALRLETRILPR